MGYCTSLILDSNKASTNVNNSYLEWFVDFRTLLLDDFEKGAKYNLNFVTLIHDDSANDSLCGCFTVESNCMTFLNNADMLNSINERYVLSNRGVFPYMSTLASSSYSNSVEGYAATFLLTSPQGYIRIQHYMTDNNSLLDNTLPTSAHALNFDIYRI